MPYSVQLYTQYVVEIPTDVRSVGRDKTGIDVKVYQVPLTEPLIEP